MKKLVFFVLFVICMQSAVAQSVEQIKESGDYFWGEGCGDSMDRADNEAMKDLVECCSSLFWAIGVDISYMQKVQKMMMTYASAQYSNSFKLVLEDGPKEYRVLRYVKTTELDTIFALRRARIAEFVNVANRSLKELQIDGALRYYYWAYLLTQSLNEPSKAKVADETGAKYMANVWLPKRINDIFSKLSNEVLKIDGNTLELGFFYEGEPVASVDFSYLDAFNHDYSDCTAIDGKALLEFTPGNIPTDIRIKYRYEYLEEAIGDEEMKMVVEAMVSAAPLPKARASVKTTKQINTTSESYANLQALENRVPDLGYKTDELISRRCDEVMQKVIAAIRSKKYYTIQDLFTDGGYDVYTRLVGYGSARLIGEPKLSYTAANGKTYCRGVSVTYSVSKDRRADTGLVFVLDEKGKIENIAHSLEDDVVNNIFNQVQDWSADARNVLFCFLETYKTAYVLKRLDYIESVFSEESMIISGGNLLKTKTQSNRGHRNYYIRRTENYELIAQLRRAFCRNDFIGIKLSDISIKKTKSANAGLYGIGIKQEFISEIYSGAGNLFLVMDFSRPDVPIIQFCYWQNSTEDNTLMESMQQFLNESL